jgi:hypothetical protein
MREPEELFLEAITAYKAWLATGKDFLNHSDIFEAWDEAVIAYAQSIFLDRNRAVCQILQGLEILK